jgi:hypothetical protein
MNHSKPWTALKKLDISGKLVRLIEICNNPRQNIIRIMEEISEPFTVKNGFKQGYALSSVIFNLALGEITWISLKENIKEVNEGFTCLVYADDLVFLGDTRKYVTQSLVIIIV